MRKPYSSYYIAPVGDRTRDVPHTVASNMVKVSPALDRSATEAVGGSVDLRSGGKELMCRAGLMLPKK